MSTALRTPAPDLLARADAVAAVARAEADTTVPEVTLPEPTVQALRESGLFAIGLPSALRGSEADLLTQLEVYERVAHADGSAGWCLMAGASASAVAGAFSGDEAAEAMFGGVGSVVHGGQFAPRGQAVPVEGGYRISGEWSFASGIAHCQWVGTGCLVLEDGVPRMDRSIGVALPEMRIFCVPREAVQLRGNWNVMGLARTGSFDYALEDTFVPEGMSFRLFEREPQRGGNLYRLGVLLLTAAGHAAFALGVGRRALDEIAALVRKRQRMGEEPMIEQPIFQLGFARNEAALRAARLLVHDAFGAVYETAMAGDPVSDTQRALTRMATTHATEVAVAACDFAYRAGGSQALRVPSAIQRCFRDMHAGGQHIFVGDKTWRDAAQVLLGTAPPGVVL